MDWLKKDLRSYLKSQRDLISNPIEKQKKESEHTKLLESRVTSEEHTQILNYWLEKGLEIAT